MNSPYIQIYIIYIYLKSLIEYFILLILLIDFFIFRNETNQLLESCFFF